MEISMFMVCDGIETLGSTPGPIFQKLVSPKLLLKSKYIPSNFSFGVCVGIKGIDCTRPNTLCFKLKDIDGNYIQESPSVAIPTHEKDENIPSEEAGIVMCIDFRNVSIEKEGIYKLELYINDDKIGDKDIPIYKGE